MEFQDIIYEKYNGRAKITINRPSVLNAFTNITLQETLKALKYAWVDMEIGVIIITGAGNRTFSVGGDQNTDKVSEVCADAKFASLVNLPMPNLHANLLQTIRTVPKPVIAAVNGYAIGGGHVLHVVCGLAIASSTAKFGQVGPRVGSFDAGYGSAYLARIVGEKEGSRNMGKCFSWENAA